MPPDQFALVPQEPLALVFHVPSAAWSADASRMELAATEDKNRLESLFFIGFRGFGGSGVRGVSEVIYFVFLSTYQISLRAIY